MWLLVLQRISLDILFDIVFFPVWWYTVGLKRAAFFAFGLLRHGNAHFAPGLWLKNIFVPMYGQRDIQGRLASFIIRLANVIGRSFALLVWLVVVLAIFLVWPLLPIFLGYMFVISLYVVQ